MTIVNEHEHGLVRVFLLDAALRDDTTTSGLYDAFCKAIGVGQLNADDVQSVDVEALEDMTLSDLLRAGYDVNEDDLTEYAFQLTALTNTDAMVLIVRSGAFIDRPVTLKTDGAAQLIATLREPEAKMPTGALPNPDPNAVLESPPQKKRPSDAAMSGRIATVALVLMALLVWLMIWIAG